MLRYIVFHFTSCDIVISENFHRSRWIIFLVLLDTLGTITVGQGDDITQGAVLTYNDTQPQMVNGAGFTASEEAIATWKFTADQGEAG